MPEPSPAPTAQHVRIDRLFAAPPARVFRAWTDPDELAAWYGPDHVDVPRDKIHIDLRVGGRWELTMLPRGGSRFTIGYDILDLAEPELLVLRSDPMPEMGLPEPTLVRVEFHAHDSGTRMILTDGPYPGTGRPPAEAGWNAAFTKLTTHLTD